MLRRRGSGNARLSTVNRFNSCHFEQWILSFEQGWRPTFMLLNVFTPFPMPLFHALAGGGGRGDLSTAERTTKNKNKPLFSFESLFFTLFDIPTLLVRLMGAHWKMKVYFVFMTFLIHY